MKAIIYPKYGPPDVLELREVGTPSPREDEVLVKVAAASANPLDWHRMRGNPFLIRLVDGLFKPKNPKLGADLAGTVAAVGPKVEQFKIGDEVFGMARGGAGAFAEFAIAREKVLALKPRNLSFAQAAAVGVVGFTALQGLRDKGHIRAGQTVLINGASGGVGSFAVQIAKSYGTEVTGVCSARNLELVRSLGADHVVDYTREDFTKGDRRYDLIFDAIANHSAFELRRALNSGGVAVMVGFSTLSHMFKEMLLEPLVSLLGDRKVVGLGMAKPNKEDLLVIRDLLDAGKVVPVIDRQYTLAQTPDAIRYLETARARGKVIITM